MSSDFDGEVPDSIRPYLNEIAERVWSERAAVMVGSGFSKNAGSEFPDWNQLGDLFFQKAHGFTPDPSQKSYQNILRLAEEVQSAIGRPALDNLLRNKIPDLSVEPSSLHVALLELPWVDVFTTNYDTLLERASAKVITRRYEPVVNKEDIPYASKPRIVKLHGSFPSERPFIITEEDYRRYPHDYAPFVNTVQQAMLENTFCLIGFSGDDPNFLQWIGWLRDNLGREKTQKIYLVGAFHLSEARMQLLAQRGTIVVDISTCPGVENHDHKKALSLFIKYIESKRPDALDWPYNPKNKYPAIGKVQLEEIRKIYDVWRRQRKSYPGWIILPFSNREKLWDFTESWVNYLPDIEDSPPGLDIQFVFELIWRLERCLLPVFDGIAEFCENILEKYWPFNDGDPPASCSILPIGGEFQELPWDDLQQAWLGIKLAMLRFYREHGHLEKWRNAEAQLKYRVGYLSADQREFLNYEGFLFSLFTLDLSGARQRLENWLPNDALPYWITKRAIALVEIGQTNNADEQIRFSLVESRKRRNKDNNSFGYLSVSYEAYQMLLFRYVRDARIWIEDKSATREEEQLVGEQLEKEWKLGKKNKASERNSINSIKPQYTFSSFDEDWKDLYDKKSTARKLEWDKRLRAVRDVQRKNELQQQNARWDELKAFRCDPWNELKLFEIMMETQSGEGKETSEKRGFDIGRITRIHQFGSIDRGEFEYAAPSFLRFCEEIGLPFRIGFYALAAKTGLASLQPISQYSTFWAIATLARLGDAKGIDGVLSRECVYNVSQREVDEIIQRCLDALNRNRDEIIAGDTIRNDSIALSLAELLPEVISRLCCKCSVEMKQRVLELISEIYQSPAKRNYGHVRNLTMRFLGSMTEFEQYMLVPSLLKIPFPQKVYIREDFLNPFLFLSVSTRPAERKVPLNIPCELVDQLHRESKLDDVERRRWALTSLVTLYRLDLLDTEHIKKLGVSLWNKVDEYGLPDGADFYKFAFLNLPFPEAVVPSQLFKKYIQSIPFPIQQNEKTRGVEITGGYIPIVQEILGAQRVDASFWTSEEAVEILQRLIEWWDADKESLRKKEERYDKLASIPLEFRARFAGLAMLLTEVVGPKITEDASEKEKRDLFRLLEEGREFELPILSAEAACLHIFPDRKSDVFCRIHEALISNQYTTTRDGLNAVEKIIVNGIVADVGEDEPDPVSSFRQYITWCPTQTISSALWIIYRFLKYSETTFTPVLEKVVLRRLDRILEETDLNKDESELDFSQKLEVRQSSSSLAAALWMYYNSHGDNMPDVILKWREACLSTEQFSEIRNPWEVCARI